MATYTQDIANYHQLILEVTESNVSIANNTSSVTVVGKIKYTKASYAAYNLNGTENSVNINGTTYNPTTAFDTRSGKVSQIFSYTQSVTHDADGSKSIPISWYFHGHTGNYAPNGTISVTHTLTKIARGATVTSVADFTDEENPTIKYSNPAGTTATSLQACISFDGSDDNIEYRDISKTGDTYTFELTEDERWALRQHCQIESSVELKFFVQTVVGGTTFRDYKTATMTIVNADPIFEAEYSDINTTTTELTEDDQIIVQQHSELQIRVRLAEAAKEAFLVDARCEVLGQTYIAEFPTATFHDGRVSLNIGTVNTERDFDVRVVVVDSRGNWNAATLTIQVAGWKTPSAIITANRHNNYYSETDIKVDANYSSIESKNTIDIKVRTKKQGTTTWSSYTTLQDNRVSVFDLDNSFAWDIQTVLTDAFSTVTINSQISRGMPIVFFDKNKNSTGFNCFPTDEDSVEVAGHIKATGDVLANNIDADGVLHVGVAAVVDGELTANGVIDTSTKYAILESDKTLNASGGHTQVMSLGTQLPAGVWEITAQFRETHSQTSAGYMHFGIACAGDVMVAVNSVPVNGAARNLVNLRRIVTLTSPTTPTLYISGFTGSLTFTANWTNMVARRLA